MVAVGNVYVLPGVPAIFRRKFDILRPMLQGQPIFGRFILSREGEGSIAAALDAVVAAFPGVTIGSYPQIDATSHKVKITVDGRELGRRRGRGCGAVPAARCGRGRGGMKPPPALVPPAVAKWQFVEEKARAVLDAFCHREMRPPLAPPGDASLAPAAAALASFAQAYVDQAGPRPGAAAHAVTRWYALGPVLRSADGPQGWRPDHQIAAVVFGAAGPSVEAELYGMAAHLLRECGVPGRQLHLILHPSDDASTSPRS